MYAITVLPSSGPRGSVCRQSREKSFHSHAPNHSHTPNPELGCLLLCSFQNCSCFSVSEHTVGYTYFHPFSTLVGKWIKDQVLKVLKAAVRPFWVRLGSGHYLNIMFLESVWLGRGLISIKTLLLFTMNGWVFQEPALGRVGTMYTSFILHTAGPPLKARLSDSEQKSAGADTAVRAILFLTPRLHTAVPCDWSV